MKFPRFQFLEDRWVILKIKFPLQGRRKTLRQKLVEWYNRRRK